MDRGIFCWEGDLLWSILFRRAMGEMFLGRGVFKMGDFLRVDSQRGIFPELLFF